MTPARFQAITQRYVELKIAVVGDFCLDRYLEIDPARQEVSLETGLPVHNVVNVRGQPGGAGTVLNNLSALGIGQIFPIGFIGDDGEGLELWSAMERRAGVQLKHMVRTVHRRTFTYCKPLLMHPGKAPVELNRLDFKNWTPTPAELEDALLEQLRAAAWLVNAIIVLEQVDIPETGVVTKRMLAGLKEIVDANPKLLVVSDSRKGLRDFPPVTLKMNAAELGALTGRTGRVELDDIKRTAADLARERQRAVFVTLAERGIVCAAPTGEIEHAPAIPLRGEIDIVGAGDAVTANLTSALTAGASFREALEVANAAGSVVIHKLGTTGTASVDEIADVMREA